jgi:hypothetical protein
VSLPSCDLVPYSGLFGHGLQSHFKSSIFDHPGISIDYLCAARHRTRYPLPKACLTTMSRERDRNPLMIALAAAAISGIASVCFWHARPWSDLAILILTVAAGCLVRLGIQRDLIRQETKGNCTSYAEPCRSSRYFQRTPLLCCRNCLDSMPWIRN